MAKNNEIVKLFDKRKEQLYKLQNYLLEVKSKIFDMYDDNNPFCEKYQKDQCKGCPLIDCKCLPFFRFIEILAGILEYGSYIVISLSLIHI